MKNKIYGVDPDGRVTPLLVRNAIIECFNQAHCADIGLESENEKMNKSYCAGIVKKAFEDSGFDFGKPTKDSILMALEKLKEFAKSFRNSNIIKKHYKEIMILVEKL